MANFRFPHHLNPEYMQSSFYKKDYIYLSLILMSTGISLWLIDLDKNVRILISGVVIGACALAVIGLIAWYSEVYTIIKLYPFRMADGLLPLFCAVLAPAVLWQHIKKIKLNFLKITTVAPIGFLFSYCLGLCYFGVTQAYWHVKGTLDSWQSNEYVEGHEIAHWITSNTSIDSVFVVSPDWGNFFVLSKRASFVSFKAVPQSSALGTEWYKRLELINGDKTIESLGYASFKEVHKNHRNLSIENLKCINQVQPVNYYLVDTSRDDLGLNLVKTLSGWYLYEINLGSSAESKCNSSSSI